jgi:UDP-N-acetylglucosamine/UDP-N-acetylgalactosamine diphosphorylase
MTNEQLKYLTAKGVVIKQPESIFIDDDVCLDNICENAVIYPGCRIMGSSVYIGKGVKIGSESPVTIKDSQLGDGVIVAGGFIDNTTMLQGAYAGDGFHSRPGTIFEEYVMVGHTVGVKQTILLPFVITGSLINFCDVLMAGGTSLENHSEVGSSYIHFNFTPHQDKATASLVGDVVNGVWLDKAPIFLGGQGGLVGPRRIAYGTVVSAGIILRRDVTNEGMLLSGGDSGKNRERPYNLKTYGQIRDVVENCLEYIAQIKCLYIWYKEIRSLYLPKQLLNGAVKRLEQVFAERMFWLNELVKKLKISVEAAGPRRTSSIFVAQQSFIDAWSMLEAKLKASFTSYIPLDTTTAIAVKKHICSSKDYPTAIQSIPPELRNTISQWLNKNYTERTQYEKTM